MTLPSAGFWRGRRVLLTGHTGFKGSWAALWLDTLGAEVSGFALAPEGAPAQHFNLAKAEEALAAHRIGDLRDRDAVEQAVRAAKPQMVIHMAAQALVRHSLRNPQKTWETNVLGTLHVLSTIRHHAPEAVVLVVTSDKVYANDDSGRAFAEDAPLGGKDPYSASKAACEILTASHRTSYFARAGQPLATVRGGNVIGGGDFAEDRVVPDIVRAALAGQPVALRHPEATRPWQHVLDCLCGYLLYAEALANGRVPPALNIGPEPGSVATVQAATEAIAGRLGMDPAWRHEPVPGSVEARMLSLDASLARRTLGWQDRLPGKAALDWTAAWYAAWRAGADMAAFSRDQIARYGALS
ncbi:MAG: CDP-glucose 4,6-dehydratase [Pseudomonadota bacterium]